jgi:NTP pyrophosphatase (non-canonical NTP hydrolase)
MDYFELECAVEDWAEEKGILNHSNPLKQALKTQEELSELMEAIIDEQGGENRTDEIEDAIGDIMVTMIIQAKMQGMTIEKCLERAYNVISKRKGRMVNGKFEKDS